MLAYTYKNRGEFALVNKEKPEILEAQDAIVRVTLASICSSDIHIKKVQFQELFRESLLDMRWWELWKQSVRKSPM